MHAFEEVLSYWDELLGTVEVQDAGFGDGYDAQPLVALSDSVLSCLGALRFLPVRRRFRFPRSVAGRDGACLQPPGSCPRTNPARGCVISSKKVTCSIGGIHPAAAACAHDSPTICYGCRLSLRSTSTSPATCRCLMKRFPFSKLPLLGPEEHEVYMQPVVSIGVGLQSLSIALARYRSQSCRRSNMDCH